MITIQAGYALVLDDEPANRDFLERLLQTARFKVSGASTGAEGLRIARAFPQLALALVDQELPDAAGLEIIMKLRQDNPEALLVMATMHDDRVLIDEAFAKGVDVFLVKPHGFMELYRRLQEVDNDTTLLHRVIIDQYGVRPYKLRTNTVPEEKSATQGALLMQPTPIAPPPEKKSEIAQSLPDTPTDSSSSSSIISPELPKQTQESKPEQPKPSTSTGTSNSTS